MIFKKIGSFFRHARALKKEKSLIALCLDICKHKLLLNVSPSDYFFCRFHDPQIRWDDKQYYVCPHGSRYWPFENIPLKFSTTLSNKYIQKHLLLGFGLPTPRLLHTVGDSMELRTRSKFIDAMTAIEGDFLLKPIQGAHGSNILVVSNTKEGLLIGNIATDIEALWEHVEQRRETGYLVESRVRNSVSIARLFPGCLNTFRVVTVRTRDGLWHRGVCGLKLGQGDSLVDNMSAGGLFVPIDEKGITLDAFGCSDSVHPDTKTVLKGIQIDNYREIVELAIYASKKFAVLGTIGWDIADTEDGLTIIEGNTVWRYRYGPAIDATIAAGLNQHRAFGRWSKDSIHPGYNKNSPLKKLLG